MYPPFSLFFSFYRALQRGVTGTETSTASEKKKTRKKQPVRATAPTPPSTRGGLLAITFEIGAETMIPGMTG